MPNRRSVRRLNACWPLKIESSGRGCFYCLARNISTDGIFLETRRPLQIGAMAWVWFESRLGGAKVVATCKVRHHYYLRYGSQSGSRTLAGMGLTIARFEAIERPSFPESIPDDPTGRDTYH